MNDFKQMKIVWGALMAGVASYAVTAAALVATGTVDIEFFAPAILNFVAPGIVVYMLAGLLIRRVLLRRLPEGDRDARVAAYASAVVIGLALTESGGLVIISLGLVTGSVSWILAGGAACIGMMLMTQPSAAEAGVDPEG